MIVRAATFHEGCAGSVVGPKRRSARGRTVLLACVLVQVMAVAVAGCTPGESGPHGNAARSPTVSTKIHVGQGPLSVAITPDGRYAYTANESDVSVIDLSGKAVVATIPFPRGPKEIKFSPDGRRAYVASGTIAGALSFIDTASRTVATTIPVDGGPLYALAVSSDGRRIYAANRGLGVALIDVQSHTVRTRTSLPVGARGGIVLSRDGRHAYIASYPETGDAGATANSVLVIDTALNTVSATIPVEERPTDLAITPDGRHVFATHFSQQETVSNAMSLIDTAANTVTGTIPVKGRSSALAVTPDGRYVYVANESGTVQVINTATGGVTVTVRVGTSPTGVTIAPDGRHAYVTDSENNLSVIDIG